MLVVNVELWDGGFPDRARTIGSLGLANVSEMAATSDYLVVAESDRGDTSEFVVRDHVRSAGFWRLVAAAAERAAADAEAAGARTSSPTTADVDPEDAPELAHVRAVLSVGRRAEEERRATARRDELAEFFIAQLDTDAASA